MPNSQNGNQSGGNTSKRGFASIDDEKQRDIASKGGQASGGNLANDPERASEAGKKGGQSSGGGTNR
jgi:general stress protein YciG